ncbi:MAG: hypothetical protein ACHQRJ_13735 [Alphaproteobacteria bacterium]
MGRVALAIFLAAVPLGFGVAALALGMDANWDLRNYHYYNAYAWLTGREGYDILAAQAPTFFNPLIDVPFFLATQAWPARLVGFLLGTLQGLNALPLYGIAYATLDIAEQRRRRLLAAALALLGMVGVGNLSELGTTFYDNVVSLGPLTSLWLILRRHRALLGGSWREIWRSLLLAGLISGIAIGLKQTIVTLPLGLAIAFLFAPTSLQRRLGLAFLYGIGVTLGMALSAGPWMLHLWQAYGNPLFPFYNQLFKSPWGLPQDYREFFFIPAGVWTRIFLPFAYLRDPHLAAEVDFRDLRILACFVLVPLAVLAAGVRAIQRRSGGVGRDTRGLFLPAQSRYVVVAFAAGYVVWVAIFCIYRYIIVYEMLAPLVIALAIDRLPLAARARALLTAAVLAVLVVTMKPADWLRVPWSERWVSAVAPKLADPDHAIVLITGHEPLSYLIPFFPPAVRFLRIHSGFTGPYEPTVRFNVEMHSIVARQRGALFVLYNPNEAAFAETHLAAYRLAIDKRACQLVPSNIGYLPYLFCRLQRTDDR